MKRSKSPSLPIKTLRAPSGNIERWHVRLAKDLERSGPSATVEASSWFEARELGRRALGRPDDDGLVVERVLTTKGRFGGPSGSSVSLEGA